MSYGQALEKAWNELSGLTNEAKLSVKLLSDIYEIAPGKRTIVSKTSGASAKDHVAVILLHYLVRKLKLKVIPTPSGEWIDFNQIKDVEGYFPTFKKRTIEHIVRKFGSSPEELLNIAGRMPAERCNKGDVGIVIHAMDGIDIMVTMWKADEEFSPDANILFDKNISEILCGEDIVVLTEYITHSL